MPRHAARFVMEAGIVGGLAAAGLIDGKSDRADAALQDPQDSLSHLGEQAVDQAGDEQLSGHAGLC
jgi:hypothetical protein